MNFEDTLYETIADLHLRIMARRAAVMAEIECLVRDIQQIALLLEALQQSRRSAYTENASRALGMAPAAAMQVQRTLRTLAKRPMDKGFFTLNGFLPAPARKTPKKSKPVSPIGRAANLTAEILRAKERGLNDQEIVILSDMIAKLAKELQ
jgi:hypothetical protein